MTATININAPLGAGLESLLMSPDILPGSAPSYETCKQILAYHPLGAKMAEKSIKKAQSQQRKISCPVPGLEARLRDAFLAEWRALKFGTQIFNTCRLARAYGIASLVIKENGVPSNTPLDVEKLANSEIAFSVFDPLNTSGSLVLNQDPNAIDFLKSTGSVTVSGVTYHRSRCVIMLNEEPLYIEYTTSAFGFVGRSVYQRALYSLKTFLYTMIAAQMLAVKVGVIIAKVEQPGTVIDGIMAAVGAHKRDMIKEAKTWNVLQVGQSDDIASINLENADSPLELARKHCILDCAAASDMPAPLLNDEALAEGFADGTEDAKQIAEHVDTIREWMEPLYEFADRIVQHRAWNREFFAALQVEFPELKGKRYQAQFQSWRRAFKADWPSVLQEPDSEKAKIDDVRLKAVIALLEVLAPMMDPANKAKLIEWATTNFNQLPMLFDSQLDLDFEGLLEFGEEQAQNAAAMAAAEAEGGDELGPKEPSVPKPFAAADGADPARLERALKSLTEAVGAMQPAQKRDAVRRLRVAASRG